MDLRARALELERQLQESSQSIRTTTTNLKRKRARAQRQGEKSSQRARVLATYWLAGNSLDLAVECWAKLRTHLHCEGEETYAAKGRRCVQKWVQEVPAAEKEEILRGSSPASRRALKHASAFIADAHVAMVALKSNIAKGFEPTSSQRWEERRKQLAPRHGNAAERSAAASKDKEIKNWGNRWRALWRFKYGKLRTRERHDIADLRDKALPEGN